MNALGEWARKIEAECPERVRLPVPCPARQTGGYETDRKRRPE